jgi:hypothetical protein
MKTNRPSESINAFAPEMAKFTSEKALRLEPYPREVDRVCDLTLLEKVAVVRIGKAVCKANDMM